MIVRDLARFNKNDKKKKDKKMQKKKKIKREKNTAQA